jgi:hypothetical protein
MNKQPTNQPSKQTNKQTNTRTNTRTMKLTIGLLLSIKVCHFKRAPCWSLHEIPVAIQLWEGINKSTTFRWSNDTNPLG